MSKKKNRSQKKYLGVLFLFLIGAVCGFFAGRYIGSVLQGENELEQLIELAFFAFALVVASFLQIIIHETGHFIGGRLTGYKFSSFRIGGFMWVKESEKVTFKKMSVLGTSGQCLMVPPDMGADGKFPFVLYNMGGALLNIMAGLLFFGLFAICRNIPYLSVFLLIMSIMGLIYAFMNGLPMRLVVDNDGYNTLSIRKNSEAARSFWMQLNMHREIAERKRLKDMPDEWFYVPSDEGMKNSMTAFMGVVACSRLMDTHQFEEAYKLIDKLIEMDSAIARAHCNLLNCDRMYCELIGENRKERLDAIMDKELKKVMKFMRNFPSVLRTAYTYALLSEKDTGKAEEIKKTFEKCARTYPYKGDIESERELMQIAEQRALQKSPY